MIMNLVYQQLPDKAAWVAYIRINVSLFDSWSNHLSTLFKQVSTGMCVFVHVFVMPESFPPNPFLLWQQIYHYLYYR